MPYLNKSDMRCWDSLQILISGLLKFGYPSNISCNKARNTHKTKLMVITLNPLGYVNNFDKNRYLEFFFESSCTLQISMMLKKGFGHSKTWV